ncbi:MAG: acetyl-CoA carboxylase biotin carboxyl carrier protein [Phycisphaerales bacterium]|nr:acetyl-CoA carboxylase biotin carboxyl carrier protein [Phycisphaerales bacterium]
MHIESVLRADGDSTHAQLRASLTQQIHTMIDIRKLKELVRLMVENELTEIDLHDQQETVTIKRGPDKNTIIQQQPAIAAPAAPVPAAAVAPAAPVESADSKLAAIESPMVGTYYNKPNPDAKNFVSVGDSIGPETVICIVEAMKVFNEIKAEQSGVIEKILVKDGDAVEFGQKMFLLK